MNVWRTQRTTSLDELEATEIGDWKMPDFKAACAYATSQGWLIVQGDLLTLTNGGVGGDLMVSVRHAAPFIIL